MATTVVKFISESLRDQLDWNRGMIFGLTAWGLLVAIQAAIPDPGTSNIIPGTSFVAVLSCGLQCPDITDQHDCQAMRPI